MLDESTARFAWEQAVPIALYNGCSVQDEVTYRYDVRLTATGKLVVEVNVLTARACVSEGQLEIGLVFAKPACTSYYERDELIQELIRTGVPAPHMAISLTLSTMAPAVFDRLFATPIGEWDDVGMQELAKYLHSRST